MTFDDARAAALQQLHAQGHLLHSQLQQIANGDAALMREVRDGLITEGLVVDRYGVALVAVGGAVFSTMDCRELEVPQSRESTIGSPPLFLAQHPLTPDGTPRFVLWSGGRETGPFPREELEQRLAEGRLQPAEFVRIDSADEWIPAAKALAQTVASPVSASVRNHATGTQTPSGETVVATREDQALTGSTAHGGRQNSIMPNPATPSGSPATSACTSSVFPPGTPTPNAPPGAPSRNPANPHGESRPAR